MIPLVDLNAQYQTIKKEICEAIDRVIETSQFVLGSEVAGFEAEFAAYSGGRHGIALNSGASALHLALLAAGIGSGDEVITVPFTFVATVATIVYTGARPILVDIDPDSYTIDVTKIERAITKRTKAILPVHLYWQPADLDPILEIARRHHLFVIEDAAQAHGAEYKGRKVGSIGDLGCFSFYPGKNLGAYGEGGMVVTNQSGFDRTIRMLRDWGQEKKHNHVLKGYNYRMDGLQGAILRVKLKHLETWTKARRAHAAHYDALLAGCNAHTPQAMPYARHVYHIYAIRTWERAVVQEALTKQGVQTGIHYPIPVHLQPAYAELDYPSGTFPHAETAAQQVLSLPLYPEMSSETVQSVARLVKQVAPGPGEAVVNAARI